MMENQIQVINVKGLRNADRAGITYVGRKFAGWEPSPLGNPYTWTRNRTGDPIQDYRRFLWEHIGRRNSSVKDELIRIAKLFHSGGDVKLGCWCRPEPCHADVVKSCIEWMLENGRLAKMEKVK